MVGEDVENDGGAIDHRHAQSALQIALLARRQLVIAGDQVGVAGGDFSLHLGQLAATYVAIGIGRLALLYRLAGGGDTGRAQQLLQLGQRVALLATADDADRKGALARTRVGDAGPTGAVARLLIASVPRPFHSDRL